MVEDIKKAFGNAEKIGVVGSPSSTGQLTIDILGTAVNKSLVGSLSVFNFMQDGHDHYALGQIVEITMQNIWSQDATIRGLIRQKGRIDPITERQDTHIAKATVSSVFSNKNGGIEQSIFGTVPSTGTSIRLLNEDVMNSLLKDYQEQLFYVGKAYGTEIKMPMWFKNFGKTGAGEAYHIGIFGKNGSGKSVLAKMIMTAYAKHAKMSIVVLDPQGEFAGDFRNQTQLKEVIEGKLGRKVEVYDLHNLALTGGFELFKKLLKNTKFLDKLGIYSDDNKERAADAIEAVLVGRTGGRNTLDQALKPWQIYTEEAFNRVWQALKTDEVLANIYTGETYQERVRREVMHGDRKTYYDMWSKIANLFRYEGKPNCIDIGKLLTKIYDDSKESKNITIIDLSEKSTPDSVLWNDMIKYVIIGEFIEKITEKAQQAFKEGKLLNSMVVIDEAHRLAPRDKSDNEEVERIKANLVDAIRTTRKYGLGWMFISQTLSSLSKDIIDQMRIYVFGFGLGWGLERIALREIIGGQDEAMELYQLFRDPQSSLTKRTYPFMTVGPISPLSFAGTPLFFNALDYPNEFINSNSLNKNMWQQRDTSPF
jgi:hypothetical protein